MLAPGKRRFYCAGRAVSGAVSGRRCPCRVRHGAVDGRWTPPSAAGSECGQTSRSPGALFPSGTRGRGLWENGLWISPGRSTTPPPACLPEAGIRLWGSRRRRRPCGPCTSRVAPRPRLPDSMWFPVSTMPCARRWSAPRRSVCVPRGSPLRRMTTHGGCAGWLGARRLDGGVRRLLVPVSVELGGRLGGDPPAAGKQRGRGLEMVRL